MSCLLSTNQSLAGMSQKTDQGANFPEVECASYPANLELAVKYVCLKFVHQYEGIPLIINIALFHTLIPY